MAHLAHEDGHARPFVVEVEVECNAIFLRIKRLYVIGYLATWNEKVFQFPFYAHEEHSVFSVNILVKVDDVAMVVGNELGDFRDDARLVWAMQ